MPILLLFLQVKWSDGCKLTLKLPLTSCLSVRFGTDFFFLLRFPAFSKLFIWTYLSVSLPWYWVHLSLEMSRSPVCFKAFSPSHRESISFSLEGLCMSVNTHSFSFDSSFLLFFFHTLQTHIPPSIDGPFSPVFPCSSLTKDLWSHSHNWLIQTVSDCMCVVCMCNTVRNS